MRLFIKGVNMTTKATPEKVTPKAAQPKLELKPVVSGSVTFEIPRTCWVLVEKDTFVKLKRNEDYTTKNVAEIEALRKKNFKEL